MGDTRTHILETAFRMFLKEGFDKVSMNALVSEAGVSKGAFYHYFESKQALFEETLHVYFFSFFELFRPSGTSDSLVEYLQVMLESYLQLMKDINRLVRDENGHVYYYLMLIGLLRDNPEMRERMGIYTRRYFSLLADLIRTDQIHGRIDPAVKADTLAEHLVCLVEGVMLVSLFDDEATKRKRFNAIIDQLLARYSATMEAQTER